MLVPFFQFASNQHQVDIHCIYYTMWMVFKMKFLAWNFVSLVFISSSSSSLPSSFVPTSQRCNHCILFFYFFFWLIPLTLPWKIFVIFWCSFFMCIVGFCFLALFIYSLLLIFHCRFKRFSVEFLIAVPFEDFFFFSFSLFWWVCCTRVQITFFFDRQISIASSIHIGMR